MADTVSHTPGPWIYDSELAVVFGPGPDHDTVADPFFDRPDEECEANARLISAAPDLLAALKAIVEETGGYVPNTMKATWHKIYDAIAKAEG